MAKEYCKVKLATEIKFLLHFTIRSTMILLILLLTHPIKRHHHLTMLCQREHIHQMRYRRLERPSRILLRGRTAQHGRIPHQRRGRITTHIDQPLDAFLRAECPNDHRVETIAGGIDHGNDGFAAFNVLHCVGQDFFGGGGDEAAGSGVVFVVAILLGVDFGIFDGRFGDFHANHFADDSFFEAGEADGSGAAAYVEEECLCGISCDFFDSGDYNVVEYFCSLCVGLEEFTRRDLEGAFTKFLFERFLSKGVL